MLRLDAPLMSFGAVVVDQNNPVERFVGRSQLVGLIANALGWDHRNTARLDALQSRLRHASRWDAEPERIVDYHTVDLGQDFMTDTGWTTRGRREDRGGASSDATHQRYRHYWANGCATVALALVDQRAPSLSDVEQALRCPARPLFIGRKTCLPAAPILLGRRHAPDLREALISEPMCNVGPRQRSSRIAACWPAEEGAAVRTLELDDLRDWRNNMHRGRQRYAVGFLEVPE